MSGNINNEENCKGIIEDLISEKCIRTIFCARRQFLKKDIKVLEGIIEKENDIDNLLKIKYSIKTSISDFKGKTYFIVLFTVVFTELIKWMLTDKKDEYFIAHNWWRVIIACSLLWLVFAVSSIAFNKSVFKFKCERKKRIIIELIDMRIKEVKKEKEAPVKNTSAEK